MASSVAKEVTVVNVTAIINGIVIIYNWGLGNGKVAVGRIGRIGRRLIYDRGYDNIELKLCASDIDAIDANDYKSYEQKPTEYAYEHKGR
ncbi:uncharacterized protein G2W53_027896 [Senna tora]|uniref:Uncharacterized protein n=1 Tax=Senna tora TaxID=362788 RepID=A0A834WK98_9FABA|nr:uncharacterized protein G2W53_027896 [Senna tora]